MALKDAQIAVQAAVHTALSANTYISTNSIPVVDLAPPKNQPVPFISVGDLVVVNDSTLGTSLQTVTLTVHSWDEGLSTLRLKTMMGAVLDALDDSSLSLASPFTLISSTFLSSQVFSDPDGMTKHGVQRFRLQVQNT